MQGFLGASPPRPAVSSLGWLPPRLLRVLRTAGHLFFGLLSAGFPTIAFAQPEPVAIYEANLHEGHTGDEFEVALTVHWSGSADAYDVPTPRPIPSTGLTFSMLGTESRQDGDRNQVRFRWRATAREADAFALQALLPAVAYPTDSPVPVPVKAEQPLTVTIMPRRSPAAWVGLCAAALAGGGAVVLAGANLRRRRRVRRDAAASRAATDAMAAQDADRFETALRHRIEGEPVAFMEGLVGLARDLEAAPAMLEDLTALRERMAFASYHPTDQELDRAAACVRKLLHDRQSPTTEESA